MAKKKTDEKSVDERVEEVFSAPEPGDVVVYEPVRAVTPVPETAGEVFCREAREVLASDAGGHVVPAGEWRRLVRVAVGLVG